MSEALQRANQPLDYYRDRRDEKILAFENSPWSQRGRLDII